MDCFASLAMTWMDRRFVGWVERSETHRPTHQRHDGYRFAPPILRKRPTTRPLADHPRYLTAPFPPPPDPNGLRNVQLSTLFSRVCSQNRLETLTTSDV